MTREELERAMKETGLAAWPVFDSADYPFVSDDEWAEVAIAAAFRLHAEHRTSVGRELTPGQRQVLREFRHLVQMFGTESICCPTFDEVWRELLKRAGPEPFGGPQPERERLAAYDGPERVVWEPQRWKEKRDEG